MSCTLQVLAKRIEFATRPTIALFGAARSATVVGTSCRTRTPQHLTNDRLLMQTKTGCDGTPVSTIEERVFFSRLMSANPGVGTKAGWSWDKFVDLWHNEVKKEAKCVYGKTSEQLKIKASRQWVGGEERKIKSSEERQRCIAPIAPSSGSSWTWIQIDAPFDNDIDAWMGGRGFTSTHYITKRKPTFSPQ